MNALIEMQAIIERLLFRMGDEQIPEPVHASLSLVFGDGCVMTYTAQVTRPGEDAPIVHTSTLVGGDEE